MFLLRDVKYALQLNCKVLFTKCQASFTISDISILLEIKGRNKIDYKKNPLEYFIKIYVSNTPSKISGKVILIFIEISTIILGWMKTE